MLFGTTRRLRSGTERMSVTLSGVILEVVSSYKYLGVWLDPCLTWQVHIDKLCNAVSSRLGVLRRLIPCLPQRTLVMLFNCMVLPKMDYCDVVWGNCGKCLSDRLQKLQNRAARLTLGLPYSHHVGNDELSTLGWKTLASRRNLHLLQSIYKAVNNDLPEYINNFQRASDSHRYPTRHSLNQSLTLPQVRRECGKRKFSYRGANLWNHLPNYIKTSTSMTVFKNKCNTWPDL